MTDFVERAPLLPTDDSDDVPTSLVAVDGRLDDVDIASLLVVKDVDTAPAGLLPYLAWEAGVDVWNAAWSDETKRAVIKASPVIKRHKGTRYAVEQALGAFGVSTELVEWWETAPKSKPYTFEVTAYVSARFDNASAPLLTPDLIRDTYAAVVAAKRHSTAFAFHIAARFPATVGVAPVLVARSRKTAAMRPERVREGFSSGIGLAPAAVARARLGVAMHPAPIREAFQASLGIAVAGVARTRVSATLIASP